MSMVDTIKAELGIKSPSRACMRWGELLGHYFQMGVLEGGLGSALAIPGNFFHLYGPDEYSFRKIARDYERMVEQIESALDWD